MKVVGALAQILLFLLLFVEAGCEQGTGEPPPVTGDGSSPLFAYASYAAEKLDIMPLTDFVSGDVEEGSPRVERGSQIKVYVSLLDSFGCQTKSPGTFRFELYRSVQRSAEPKGGRIVIWPDVDLTEPAENNNYWHDFLRAYEFNLDFEPESGHNYILQVTCLCPNGRRLSDDFVLKYVQ